MAEENEDQDLEAEMLRMMEQELGEETSDEDAEPSADMLESLQTETEGDAGDEADLEAEMLRAMMAETAAETPEEAQMALDRAHDILPGADINTQNVHRLLDIRLPIIIELGRAETPISTVLEWAEGSLIELEKVSGEAVDVYINGKPFARGEVVTIAENFGVRITELLP